MLFGHNTDVKVGDTVYHVQTEDRGTANALIDTTVYCRGRVLHRRTNNYIDLLPIEGLHESLLRKRIDDQHRAVMEEIRSGALKLIPPPPPSKDIAPAQPAASAPANPISAKSANTTSAPANASPAPTLALELLNPKTWLAGKHANLHLAVRHKLDRIAVAGAKIVAHIEGSVYATEYTAETDASGHAQLEFEMPHLDAGEPALIIEATQGNLKGQLKFHLRARPRVPTA
jgi:hypothetical protein